MCSARQGQSFLAALATEDICLIMSVPLSFSSSCTNYSVLNSSLVLEQIFALNCENASLMLCVYTHDENLPSTECTTGKNAVIS